MKETEKQKRIKEELILLNRRVERLTEEISNCMNEIVVITEINLCLESILKLKEEYAYAENRVKGN